MNEAMSGKASGLRIDDPFWSHYLRMVREVMIPYQWEALNDRVEGAEPSHAIRNFKIAAGREPGEFHGMVFQDSDIAKWVEAAAYLLKSERDPALEQLVDEVVDLIADAQREDGYLNTYFTLKEPGREWTNLAECHELYCAGHFIEAGVAYYQATGKRKLLDVVSRLADCIGRTFGREPGKLAGYDGHQEIELALVKLYRATGEKRHLALSEYFLTQRGAKPHYFEQEWEKRGNTLHFPQLSMVHEHTYSQSHLPVREQSEAVGHAVRLVYMATAMADVALETGDEGMKAACRRLWESITAKRMYITGGIGSMEQGESFTTDYDLPGDLAYAETCASVGLIFFAKRMLELDGDSRYADVLEKALYNTVIGGISLDGTRFFYVNPLEVYPDVLGKNKNYEHVKAERQGWFTCACCPPNAARLLASLGDYVYRTRGNTLFVDLYMGSKAEVELKNGFVGVEVQSTYSAQGQVRLTVAPDSAQAFTLALRMPEWSDRVEMRVNGTIQEDSFVDDDGYIRMNRIWSDGDQVELSFGMPVRRMKSHPLVRQTYAKTALQRGPFLYCLEEADNGKRLYQLRLAESAAFRLEQAEGLPGDIPALVTEDGYRLRLGEEWSDQLYGSGGQAARDRARLTFVPYYAWANRGIGEMSVWVAEGNL